jgi:hypothetical protein
MMGFASTDKVPEERLCFMWSETRLLLRAEKSTLSQRA